MVPVMLVGTLESADHSHEFLGLHAMLYRHTAQGLRMIATWGLYPKTFLSGLGPPDYCGFGQAFLMTGRNGVAKT